MQVLILALTLLAGAWGAAGAASQAPGDRVIVEDGGNPQPKKNM
jgi:hypothetical protein